MEAKKKFFRLIEFYLNEFKGDVIQEFYGKGTKIKIHSFNYSISNKSVMIEAVIVLGDVINEEVLDREMADVLVQESLVYFFPEFSVKTMVRWDV